MVVNQQHRKTIGRIHYRNPRIGLCHHPARGQKPTGTEKHTVQCRLDGLNDDQRDQGKDEYPSSQSASEEHKRRGARTNGRHPTWEQIRMWLVLWWEGNEDDDEMTKKTKTTTEPKWPRLHHVQCPTVVGAAARNNPTWMPTWLGHRWQAGAPQRPEHGRETVGHTPRVLEQGRKKTDSY
jgi:hypothetical protein